MQTYHALVTIGTLLIAILFLTFIHSDAIPLSYESERAPTIDEFVQLLRKSYDLQSKRGLDFGLHRGHSGMMSAKYLAGLEMAGPMGPGRKRRSDQLDYEIDPYDYHNYLNTVRAIADTKRGLDLGFGRGYSGIQTARHLIGLEEANDAMGPGRRRRGATVTVATADQNKLSDGDNPMQSDAIEENSA